MRILSEVLNVNSKKQIKSAEKKGKILTDTTETSWKNKFTTLKFRAFAKANKSFSHKAFKSPGENKKCNCIGPQYLKAKV